MRRWNYILTEINFTIFNCNQKNCIMLKWNNSIESNQIEYEFFLNFLEFVVGFVVWPNRDDISNRTISSFFLFSEILPSNAFFIILKLDLNWDSLSGSTPKRKYQIRNLQNKQNQYFWLECWKLLLESERRTNGISTT